MFNLLRRGSGQLPKMSTDMVIPLRTFDDVPHLQSTILYSTFLFNDVLDPSKLQNSLKSLVERDGWNKLAARLRRNVSSAYYIMDN
jgi:hypothetical protein